MKKSCFAMCNFRCQPEAQCIIWKDALLSLTREESSEATKTGYCDTYTFVCQMTELRKFSFPQFLEPFRSFWTTTPRRPCATPHFAPPERYPVSLWGAELRLRRWGRGDVGLQECALTHFLPGSGPNPSMAGSSPAS